MRNGVTPDKKKIPGAQNPEENLTSETKPSESPKKTTAPEKAFSFEWLKNYEATLENDDSLDETEGSTLEVSGGSVKKKYNFSYDSKNQDGTTETKQVQFDGTKPKPTVTLDLNDPKAIAIAMRALKEMGFKKINLPADITPEEQKNINDFFAANKDFGIEAVKQEPKKEANAAPIQEVKKAEEESNLTTTEKIITPEMIKNAFTSLGLSEEASREDIERAARKLLAESHPNQLSGGDIKKYHEIQNARDIALDSLEKPAMEKQVEQNPAVPINTNELERLIKEINEKYSNLTRENMDPSILQYIREDLNLGLLDKLKTEIDKLKSLVKEPLEDTTHESKSVDEKLEQIANVALLATAETLYEKVTAKLTTITEAPLIQEGPQTHHEHLMARLQSDIVQTDRDERLAALKEAGNAIKNESGSLSEAEKLQVKEKAREVVSRALAEPDGSTTNAAGLATAPDSSFLQKSTEKAELR